MPATEPRSRRKGRFDVAVAATAALLIIMSTLPILAPHTPIGWELGCLVGFVSALLILALFVLPVRARESTPIAPLTLVRHRDIALVALAGALIHTLALLGLDTTLIEYVKYTAPGYLLLGLLALLLLSFLVATGFEPVRRRLWQSQRGFRSLHVALGIVLVVATAAHVIASGRYLDKPWKLAVWVGGSVVALLAVLRARRGQAAADVAPLRREAWKHLVQDSTFGTRAVIVCILVLAAALLLAALPFGQTVRLLKQSPLRRHAMLVLDFPHAKHRTVACLACHHNFVDRTGQSGCIACHRSTRADLRLAAEPRFHDFCFACHVEAERRHAKHGPLRACDGCHVIRERSTQEASTVAAQ